MNTGRKKTLFQDFKSKNFFDLAASSAFFFLISCIPMLILIAALLPYSNTEQKDFIRILTNATPDFIDPMVTQLVKDAFRHSNGISSGGIISVALFAIIYAASRGSVTLIRTLNVIYDCKERENTFRANLKAIATTLVFVFALFISLVAMVFGNSIRNSIKISVPDFKSRSLLFSNIRYLLIFVLLTGFFALLYTYLPDEKHRIEDQILGAVFSSLGWGGFSYVFSMFIKGGSIYKTYYGSLSTLVIFLVWLYWCFLIFLFGAYINKNASRAVNELLGGLFCGLVTIERYNNTTLVKVAGKKVYSFDTKGNNNRDNDRNGDRNNNRNNRAVKDMRPKNTQYISERHNNDRKKKRFHGRDHRVGRKK
ncbi:MAG: YihY/virulence factor BrkB family protein [Lachnospiraceae bacterium]|nr:YihY/virulence factor BrkB family protein [Lachnospiraceae bacterium]